MQNIKTNLTQVEKKKVANFQQRTYKLIMEMGQLSITKYEVSIAQKKNTDQYQQLQKQIQNFNIQLKNKYGNGKIDIQNQLYVKE